MPATCRSRTSTTTTRVPRSAGRSRRTARSSFTPTKGSSRDFRPVSHSAPQPTSSARATSRSQAPPSTTRSIPWVACLSRSRATSFRAAGSDPVALNLLQYMVAPNSAPDAAGNNFVAQNNSRFDTYTSGIVRVDHNINTNNRVFARYAHNGRRETRAFAGRSDVARTAGTTTVEQRRSALDLTSTINPTTVGTLRAGWTRHRRLDISTPEDLGGNTFNSSTLGFPTSFAAVLPSNRFVPMSVADYGGAQVGQGGGQDGVADDYYVQAQATQIRGRHQLKAGVEFRTAHSLVENPYRGVSLGAFNHTRNFTSLRPNVATLTRGRRRQRLRVVPARLHRHRQRSASEPRQLAELLHRHVLQDDWRLSSRLTAERGPALGLRGADHRDRITRSTPGSTTTAWPWCVRPVRARLCRASFAAD